MTTGLPVHSGQNAGQVLPMAGDAHALVLPHVLPDILICVLCRDAASYVFPFFDALLRQDYPVDKIHIRAIDLGSGDRSLARLREMKSLLAERFAGFDVLPMRPRTLPGTALNTALSLSRRAASGGKDDGEEAASEAARHDGAAPPYVAVLSVETRLAPRALEAAVAMATSSPADIAAWEFKHVPPSPQDVALPSDLETAWAQAYCTLYRRRALEVMGGFASAASVAGLAVEAAYRLRDSGYRLVYCSGAAFSQIPQTSTSDANWRLAPSNPLYDITLDLRYGTARRRLSVPFRLLARWKRLQAGNGRLGRREALGRLMRNAPAFVARRKRVSRTFPICGWALGLLRAGCRRFAQDRVLASPHPLVSIVVRTAQGREGFLQECLCALAHQSYDNIEVIIVEDGESGCVDKLLTRVGLEEAPRIVSVQSSVGGRSRAGNIGLACARGTYMTVIDDDHLLFPRHVERLVQALEKDIALGGAYAVSLEVETSVLSVDPLIYCESRRRRRADRPYSKALLWQEDYIPVNAMMFRRRCYERLGGFDERLEAAEAWDLWIRYSLEAPCAFVKDVTSVCRVSADSLPRKQEQDRLARNRALVREKQEGYKRHLPLVDSLELTARVA